MSTEPGTPTSDHTSADDTSADDTSADGTSADDTSAENTGAANAPASDAADYGESLGYSSGLDSQPDEAEEEVAPGVPTDDQA
ncbi:MAG: hypothetical protein RI885_1060 [Actinomycetota bacterium]|jgi:hypothetical protein